MHPQKKKIIIISGNIVITEMYSNYEHLGVNVLLYYIYIILCCIKYCILYYSSFIICANCDF